MLSVEVIVSEVDQSGRPAPLLEVSVLIGTNIHLAEIVHLHRGGSERAQANLTLTANPEVVLGPCEKYKLEQPKNPEFPSLPTQRPIRK